MNVSTIICTYIYQTFVTIKTALEDKVAYRTL